MLDIKIKTISPKKLTYNRVGDWHWEDDRLLISVANMKDFRHEWILGIHEIVEAFLCKIAGITEEEIDAFDQKHEGKFIPGGPGYFQHMLATAIEMVVTSYGQINWQSYEEEISKAEKDNGEKTQETENARDIKV